MTSRTYATPKLMGVCARFANWSGIDATVGLVLVTLFAFGPLAVIAYLLIGWLAA